MACECVNVRPGTYANSVDMWTPWFYSNGRPKLATVDRCICMEILTLWGLGIRTLECCCGHGVASGYIMVYEDCIETMLELGYRQKLRGCEFFYPFGEGVRLAEATTA